MSEALLLLSLAGHPHRYDHPWLCHHNVFAHFTSPFDLAMYGRTYWGNERTTFVVGSDGKVAEVLRKVKPAEHDTRVLKTLERVAPPTR
jgi:peroxiredoxin